MWLNLKTFIESFKTMLHSVVKQSQQVFRAGFPGIEN